MRIRIAIVIFLLTIVIVAACVETFSGFNISLDSSLDVEPNIEVITVRHKVYLEDLNKMQQQLNINPGLSPDGEKPGEDKNPNTLEINPSSNDPTTSASSATDAEEDKTDAKPDKTGAEENGTVTVESEIDSEEEQISMEEG